MVKKIKSYFFVVMCMMAVTVCLFCSSSTSEAATNSVGANDMDTATYQKIKDHMWLANEDNFDMLPDEPSSVKEKSEPVDSETYQKMRDHIWLAHEDDFDMIPGEPLSVKEKREIADSYAFDAQMEQKYAWLVPFDGGFDSNDNGNQ